MSKHSYVFNVDLIYEPTGQGMNVNVEWDVPWGVDPESIMGYKWPDRFAENILENISIIPLSWDVIDED